MKSSHLVLWVPSLVLAAVSSSITSCTAEFKAECPEGTTQEGGGDVDDACVPAAGAAGVAGGGGEGGAAGTGGTAGSAPVAGSGGGGGSSPMPPAGSGGAGAGGEAGGGLDFARDVLALGGGDSCALASNQVFCWGVNSAGQLGIGNETSISRPTLVDSTSLGNVVQVALGTFHSCALRDDGRVLCWGTNSSGQLGVSTNNGTNEANVSPLLVNGQMAVNIRQMALGQFHTCAVREDGRVLCWGINGSGQLGRPNDPDVSADPTPTLIDSADLIGVRQVALGSKFSCALRTDGRVLCWGSNENGQLGSTVNINSGEPNPVPRLVESPNLTDVRQIALGYENACALRVDGHVLCWGRNARGQVGTTVNTEDANVPTPTLVDNGKLANIKQIALGDDYSCALRDDGRVLCWGVNDFGQLGTSTNVGTTSPNPVPVLVDDGNLVGVSYIATGREHSCALRDDGRVLCWGNNVGGALGNDSTATTNPVPTVVNNLPALTL